MKQITPSYFDSFSCIADRCRHTCCAGWEIDIDEPTAAFYRTVDGALGDRLKAAMQTDKDGVTSFALTAEERCPMLNDNGLCDLITAFGEEALCDICHAHPRFRFDYSDRTEWGLGLCCEAAASLILRQNDPVRLQCREESPSPSPTDEERDFFEKRRVAFSIVQDRTLSIDGREAALAAAFGVTIPTLSVQRLAALYASLERMDPAWDDTLIRLRTEPSAPLSDALTVAREHLLWYFLYRHLPPSLDDGRFGERIAFSILSERMISLIAAVHGGTMSALEEAARAYSAEIEYSDCNIDALLDIL